MEEKLNLLTSMRIGISTDKKLIRVDLQDASKENDSNIFASFVLPVESYQSMISSFIKSGIRIESEFDVDLGFKSAIEGENDEN